MDLLDWFRPGKHLSWRKLLALVRNLPPESALNTAIRNDTPESELAKHGATSDPAQARWSTIETLMAALIDEVRVGNWAFVQVHSESKVNPPTPIRRPGVKARRGKMMTLEEAQKIDPRLRGLSEEEAQAKLDIIAGRGR